MKKKVTLKKIHLESFIEILISVYNGGADFIDLEGVPDTLQDYIGITIPEEYMSKDVRSDDKLTENDLNELLN